VHAEQRTLDPGRDSWQLTAFHVQADADVHAGHQETHPGLAGGIGRYLPPE
jgi:hypothetical protein